MREVVTDSESCQNGTISPQRENLPEWERLLAAVARTALEVQ